MADINIFQVFHKDYPRSTSASWITPIGVSGYKPEEFASDGDGNNIAYLNKFYCELTAMYYIWKNEDHNYVGLYHYRRYLNFKKDNSILDETIPGRKIYDTSIELIEYLSDNSQYELIKKHMMITDVVIPRKSTLLPSIKNQYINAVEVRPWIEFEHAIKRKYGNNESYIDFFQLSSFSPICNMFIMKKEVYNKYCHDLFELIDNIYGTIGTPYDDYNNRYPGFLAERFMGFWLHINNISYLEVPMIALK